MTSILTNSIGSAAAGVVTPLQNNHVQSRDSGQNTNQNNMARVSQAAATKQASEVKVKEKERMPQIPKRVEATYTAKGKKKVPGKHANPEDQDPEKEGKEKNNSELNLTA